MYLKTFTAIDSSVASFSLAEEVKFRDNTSLNWSEILA